MDSVMTDRDQHQISLELAESWPAPPRSRKISQVRAPGYRYILTPMLIEKVGVLEDDSLLRNNLEQQLRKRGYEVSPVATLAAAQRLLATDSLDLMILDVRLPDGEGTDLLDNLQTLPHKPLMVVISGHGTVESAAECIRKGAFDYLLKPFTPEQLEITLKKAENYRHLVKVSQYLSHEEDEEIGADLLGQSQSIQQLRNLIRKVGRTQATVLIQGESGTGKELVARALYRQSARASAPFIKVNCAAIPENLIESEFFGHEKGAFTGALNKREGRFELANGGTILLDEISEISPAVQAKLLRVLQEREFERLGGNRSIKVDVRVIATTNRHLEECVSRNEFRKDLYFRLNVIPISIPPLREHKEDILLLANEFRQRLNRKHGMDVTDFDAESRRILREHDWPGNVRELQNVIERAVILCGERRVVDPDCLAITPAKELSSPEPQAPGAKRVGHFPTLDEIEKDHILSAMDRCHGHRTRAAKLLGISIRTLRNKLNEYHYTGPADD